MFLKKEITGYEGKYSVSENGEVFNDLKQLEVTQRVTPYGYKSVSLNGRHMAVHRLVAIAFIPNPENKAQVNHKDLNKVNNHVSNLEWMTQQENIAHYLASEQSKAHTERKKSRGWNGGDRTKESCIFLGEAHGRHKVTAKQVLKIRKVYNSKMLTQKELAKLYGVSDVAIFKIVHRKTWTHI